MKRYIKSSDSDYRRQIYQRGGKKFAVYSKGTGATFEVRSISMLSPYDDANYYWANTARLKDGTLYAQYREENKADVEYKESLIGYDPKYYEEDYEYHDEIIITMCDTLLRLNKNIDKKIVHN